MSTHEDGAAQMLMDRYRVLEELGHGSFGTTFAAFDEQTERRVAVKQLDLSRVDDWKAVELFEREAQTLEQLDHPRIPAYIDFVPVQSEASGYLVQALAPGRSLADILGDRGTFTDVQIEEIARQVLELLSYLASLNPPVVHRDIKPANLLLDEQMDVYLVDFGAVQDAASRAEAGSTVAGTFGYMAPEQLHGEASPRSDLHGLGMTLVHLASGTDPSSLERDGLKVAFADVVDLPESLVDFIDRLVEPNPDDRFDSPRTALAFLNDEVPVSGSVEGLVGDEALAAMVRRRERQEQVAERRRRRELARKAASMESRVDVVRDEDGLLVTIGPDDNWARFTVPLSIGLFIIVNPGVFIVIHFFAGSAWPIIDEPTLEHTLWRWAIWTGLVIAGVIASGRMLRPDPVNLRITDDHFMIFQKDPESPAAFGRTSDLTVTALVPEDSATGFVSLDVDGEGQSFTLLNLSPDDVELVDQLVGDIGPSLNESSW